MKEGVGIKNGATGRSDIEGKAVRVTASDSGSERVSIKKAELGRKCRPKKRICEIERNILR